MCFFLIAFLLSRWRAQFQHSSILCFFTNSSIPVSIIFPSFVSLSIRPCVQETPRGHQFELSPLWRQRRGLIMKGAFLLARSPNHSFSQLIIDYWISNLVFEYFTRGFCKFNWKDWKIWRSFCYFVILYNIQTKGKGVSWCFIRINTDSINYMLLD